MTPWAGPLSVSTNLLLVRFLDRVVRGTPIQSLMTYLEKKTFNPNSSGCSYGAAIAFKW